MKMSIQWHEECIRNHKRTLILKLRSAINEAKRIQESIREYQFHQKQIEEAKRQKKDGFDEEKFLVKRKKK